MEPESRSYRRIVADFNIEKQSKAFIIVIDEGSSENSSYWIGCYITTRLIADTTSHREERVI
jgi:hypothetical protein